MDAKVGTAHAVTNLHTVHVMWPDCDPAGIVFYGNYYRWMDDATHFYFVKIGLPFDRMMADYGSPGVPLVSAHADFRTPAKFRDVLSVESFVSQCGRSSFTMTHIFRCGDRLVAEAWEKRVWCKADPKDPAVIEAIPIPDDVRTAMGWAQA